MGPEASDGNKWSPSCPPRALAPVVPTPGIQMSCADAMKAPLPRISDLNGLLSAAIQSMGQTSRASRTAEEQNHDSDRYGRGEWKADRRSPWPFPTHLLSFVVGKPDVIPFYRGCLVRRGLSDAIGSQRLKEVLNHSTPGSRFLGWTDAQVFTRASRSAWLYGRYLEGPPWGRSLPLCSPHLRWALCSATL